jgi:hypothetical protein
MSSSLMATKVVATYGPDDCFDGRGLVAGKVSSRFVAAEEVVAYQLAKQAVSDLIAEQRHLWRAAVLRPVQQAQCPVGAAKPARAAVAGHGAG